MKVALINTADAGGGAPAACMRLLNALQSRQVAATLAVKEKMTANSGVVQVVPPFWGKVNFFKERLPFILFHEKNKSVRFAFSTANAGSSIAHNPVVAEADILHIHWTNSGYLSVKNLKELFALGKPVVWTLHDMWAFTGGCHYSGGCENFLNECGNCWMLRKPHHDDLSHTGWVRKAAMLNKAKNLHVVACSNWLAGVAKSSSLFSMHKVSAIPNPIDTAVFAPRDKAVMRIKWKINPAAPVILFGAANINDRRKGIGYLVAALDKLKYQYEGHPEPEVVIFGKNKHFDVKQLPFKVTELNIISSQTDLAEIYSLADVFVSPSVEDNLPNMIMEALACGTPVAAFNTGGIPDMVDHLQNGYLAEYKSADDLAAGIRYILAGHRSSMASAARAKVLANFTPETVAGQYITLYQNLLDK